MMWACFMQIISCRTHLLHIKYSPLQLFTWTWTCSKMMHEHFSCPNKYYEWGTIFISLAHPSMYRQSTGPIHVTDDINVHLLKYIYSIHNAKYFKAALQKMHVSNITIQEAKVTVSRGKKSVMKDWRKTLTISELISGSHPLAKGNIQWQ